MKRTNFTVHPIYLTNEASSSKTLFLHHCSCSCLSSRQHTTAVKDLHHKILGSYLIKGAFTPGSFCFVCSKSVYTRPSGHFVFTVHYCEAGFSQGFPPASCVLVVLCIVGYGAKVKWFTDIWLFGSASESACRVHICPNEPRREKRNAPLVSERLPSIQV